MATQFEQDLAPKLTLLACQVTVPPTPSVDARDAHVARLAEMVDRNLSDQRVDLVVLPELSCIDYSREAFDQLNAIAEPAEGPSFQTFSVVARRHNTTIAFGIAEAAETDFHISQVVIGPDGALIGTYRKIHIAQFGASMEKEYFQAAPQLLVFEINGIRIAPIICYDIRVPELCRTLCLKHGADLILHCGAYARDLSFHTWPHFAVTRALENQVHFLSLNRAGPEFGSSMYCPPWIDETQPQVTFGVGEEIRRFVIDLAKTAEVRETYSFLADRLDDYENLPLH